MPTHPPLLTLDVNLKSVSIPIMSKTCKLKCNTILKLYFVSSKNLCDLQPLNVPYACKCACFTHESEASSSRNEIFDLECSTPPQANVVVKSICPKRFALMPKPTMRENQCF